VDPTALSLFYARMGLNKVSMNAYNFPGVASGIEMQLQSLCRGFYKYAAGHGSNEAGKLSDSLHYLALYVYGLIKSAILSPNMNAPLNSVYLDQIADMKFKVNTMSPEEVLCMLHPQIYQVSNVDWAEGEFPAMEQPIRATLSSSEVYLVFDSHYVYLFVGHQVDSYFVEELFEVQDIR
jgi:hypothetical protein